MYATINIPGSRHFDWYGPASKAACKKWLEARVADLQRTELLASLLPQRIVSNAAAESWTYLSGSAVIRPRLTDADMRAVYGAPSQPCGCPAERHYQRCPGATH